MHMSHRERETCTSRLEPRAQTPGPSILPQEGGDFYTHNRDANTRYFLGFRNCMHMLPSRDQTRDSVIDAAEKGANMEIDARPLTRWSPEHPPSILSPFWMQDVVAFWSQHSLDHVEVKAIKNAELGVDLLHHNSMLDLSQNPHQTEIVSRPGITGCLTPVCRSGHV